MDTKPRRRKSDHWLSFLHREAAVVVLAFVVLGVLAMVVTLLLARFNEHDRRVNASLVCLLRAAGTPVTSKVVQENLDERDRLFNACIHQQAPGVKSPLQKEKHVP